MSKLQVRPERFCAQRPIPDSDGVSRERSEDELENPERRQERKPGARREGAVPTHSHEASCVSLHMSVTLS